MKIKMVWGHPSGNPEWKKIEELELGKEYVRGFQGTIGEENMILEEIVVRGSCQTPKEER